ncbi:MAG TPA: tetratricopeptide repeat protein, partial [Pyrinomonadaceae bacterium]|nr:tetratricopeptide repeat protein [Pyrinomonadaceae bacterium]
GNFDEVFRQLDNAGEPDNALVRTFRALALYYTGQTDAAAELMEDVVEKHPNMHGIRPFMAMFLSAQGKHAEALAQINPEVKRNGEVDADISYSIGSVYALEGLSGDAFEWLERSIALGNANKPCFENDPNWASLRADPRFVELTSKTR